MPPHYANRIDGSTATIPLTAAALRHLRGDSEHLHHNTTDDAYQNLIEGTKDVIFVTAPSEDELAAATKAGVELEVIPIVKDALVFLANSDNPVTGLSQQQIQDIYTGRVTNWNQLGGRDAGIVAYQRPTNSGSQTLFLQLAMENASPVDPPVYHQPYSMGDLMDVISGYDNARNAIGYSVYYYTQYMYASETVKLLAIDSVIPTTQTISDGTYPYGTHYFAVVRRDEPADSWGRQLIAWLLTPEGQQVASSVGYVPLDPSNIVPLANEYGYYGSTPENTTQSQGSGGSVGYSPKNLNLPCLKADEYGDITDECWLPDGQLILPGYPQAEAAARTWLATLPDPAPINDPQNQDAKNQRLEVFEDLVIPTRVLRFGEYSYPLTTESAVFRLSDGQRMSLSDLFYDKVNYIEFINQNLLDIGRNRVLNDCDYCTSYQIKPFTGIPTSYDQFSFAYESLSVRFPVGNPFVVNEYDGMHIDSHIPLNLPADLSPYGTWWRLDEVMIGNTVVEHVVRNYFDPHPADSNLNRNIDAFAANYPKILSVTIHSLENDRLSVCAVDPLDGHCLKVVQFDYTTGNPLDN